MKERNVLKFKMAPGPYICCLQENHLKPKYTYSMNVEGWKKVFHAHGVQKNVGVAIFISDKID